MSEFFWVVFWKCEHSQFVKLHCSHVFYVTLGLGLQFSSSEKNKIGSMQYRSFTINTHAVCIFHREIHYKTETTLTYCGVVTACSCELSYRPQRSWSYTLFVCLFVWMVSLRHISAVCLLVPERCFMDCWNWIDTVLCQLQWLSTSEMIEHAHQQLRSSWLKIGFSFEVGGSWLGCPGRGLGLGQRVIMETEPYKRTTTD